MHPSVLHAEGTKKFRTTSLQDCIQKIGHRFAGKTFKRVCQCCITITRDIYSSFVADVSMYSQTAIVKILEYYHEMLDRNGLVH